jgi:hypothetical protein
MEGSFVEKIRNRMSKIEQSLTQELRLKYQSQIDMIYRLLDLFEDTGGVSKEIKKKLDEATKKVADAIKGQNLIATKGLTPTKPTLDFLDEDTINKAKMAQASSIFLESNGNVDATSEGLVLHNPETNEVKVAFRGTSTSFKRPFESIKDLTHDARLISGTEAYGREGGSLNTGRDLIQSAIDKYGTNLNDMEIVGYSLGGGKGILLGDEFGIKTTTFNPLIGYNSMKASTTSTPHNIFRTTEDITSLGAGFGTVKKNWNVQSILPKKNSLDVRPAHRLNNFLDNEGRATGKSPLQTKIDRVVETGKKKAQVEDMNDAIDFLQNQLEINYPTSEELLDENPFPDVPRPKTPELGETDEDRRLMSEFEDRMSMLRDEPMLGEGTGTQPVRLVKGAPPKPLRQNVFNPDEFKNKSARAMANMRKGEFETFDITPSIPQEQETLPMKQYTGKASDIDLGMFDRPTKKISDIDFDDIKDFNKMNSTKEGIGDFELSSITDSEKDNLLTGNDKNRNAFEEITNEDYNNAISDLEEHIKIPTGGDLEIGGIGSDILRGLHPTNLLGGLGAGILSAEAVNLIDPNQKITAPLRESMVGSGAGFLTGFGSTILGGASSSVLLPETIAGGLGMLAGEETTKAVTKLTGSEAAGDVTGGGVGGGVGGLALGLGTALAADVGTGAAIGTAFDPVTLGLGTAVGAGIGAAIGGISYGLHKLFS